MIAAGFPDPVLHAQSAFRAILDALAHPGTAQPLQQAADAPEGLSAGAAAVALALCDHDTPVWLDPALSASPLVAEWLRFHCGCPIVTASGAASFAFAANIRELPPLDAFDLGTADYPDRSTTLVLSVEGFGAGQGITLQGPGIRGRMSFQVNPLPADMAARLAANRALFPRGIDHLLVTADSVAALPRSVRVVEA